MGFFEPKKVFALVLYGSVSIFLVLLNKKIFIGSFSYPLLTTWIQQVCGLTCYFLTYLLIGKLFQKEKLFSKPTIEYEKLLLCIPMSVSCALFILLSNLCLKYVPMSSYAVARSLTLFFNVILSIIILKQKISNICIFGCSIVIFGFVTSSFDSSSLNPYGIIAGASSSLFQSIYTIKIKSISSKFNHDEFQVYWYNVFLTSFLTLIPVFIFKEYKAFIELSELEISEILKTIIPILISGLLNFLLGMTTNWCIQTTSPIAYNLTGYVKSGIQTMIGIVFNNETCYLSTIIGLVMTISGSAIYTFGNLIKFNKEKLLEVNSKQSYEEIIDSKISDQKSVTTETSIGEYDEMIPSYKECKDLFHESSSENLIFNSKQETRV